MKKKMSKRIVIVGLLAAMFLLTMVVPPAFAAGEGPPAGVKKGEFTQIDQAQRTVVFESAEFDQPVTFKLGDAINAADIKLNEKVMVTTEDRGGQETVKEISTMFLGVNAKTLASLLIIGFIGGLLSGFIGSGGAFVLTPAMMSLGVPGAIAVATNMCHKFPKAMVGAYKRHRYGQVDLKLGMIIAISAIVGVQIGIQIQKFVLHSWGSAGSDLYVSIVFVIVLVVVGAYVFKDAWKMARSGAEEETSNLALAVQKIKIPPMIRLKTGATVSVWVTVPVGIATGMLAATIAVGGFIGVPGMIYVIGAPALVATATELIVAFAMGAWGSVQWAISGLVDIRLVVLIMAGSLVGVQLGALGTTYVKDYVIKVVMATTMLIVAVSRGVKVPVYLTKLEIISSSPNTISLLDAISFWIMVAALVVAGTIIIGAMIKGMARARAGDENASEAVTEGA